MDPNEEIEDLEVIAEDSDDESVSVDDFIRELEAKEKDLHITAETTIIEIEQGFDDGNPTDFLKSMHSFEPPTEIAPAVKQADPEEDLLVQELKEEKSDMEAKLARLNETISKMEEERAEMFKNSQRRAKDYENFKARTERERNDIMHSQVSTLATQLLPAIDNLNRALEHSGSTGKKMSGEFKQFFEGIELVNQQVNDIFAGMGIKPIPAVGEVFDPHLHEAVATEESDEFPANVICEELLRGYRIGDRVIRHSMVKVYVAPPGHNGTGPSEKDETARSNDDADTPAVSDEAEIGDEAAAADDSATQVDESATFTTTDEEMAESIPDDEN